MLSSLTVALSIISIITSYIIIDHNLIISLCLLVIFCLTFMLTLVLYLKPKVLQNECANDDHLRNESAAAVLPHSQQLPRREQAQDHLLKPQEQFHHRESLEQDLKRQFYLHLWRMKAAKVCLEQSLKLDSDDNLESRNAYRTLLGVPALRATSHTNAIHHYGPGTATTSSQLSVPSHQSINNLKHQHSLNAHSPPPPAIS